MLRSGSKSFTTRFVVIRVIAPAHTAALLMVIDAANAAHGVNPADTLRFVILKRYLIKRWKNGGGGMGAM